MSTQLIPTVHFFLFVLRNSFHPEAFIGGLQLVTLHGIDPVTPSSGPRSGQFGMRHGVHRSIRVSNLYPSLFEPTPKCWCWRWTDRNLPIYPLQASPEGVLLTVYAFNAGTGTIECGWTFVDSIPNQTSSKLAARGEAENKQRRIWRSIYVCDVYAISWIKVIDSLLNI